MIAVVCTIIVCLTVLGVAAMWLTATRESRLDASRAAALHAKMEELENVMRVKMDTLAEGKDVRILQAACGGYDRDITMLKARLGANTQPRVL